eukprot:1715127-Amphidinium_carterae.1
MTIGELNAAKAKNKDIPNITSEHLSQGSHLLQYLMLLLKASSSIAPSLDDMSRCVCSRTGI